MKMQVWIMEEHKEESNFWFQLWIITFIILTALFFLEQYFNRQAMESLIAEYNITLESTTMPEYNTIPATRPASNSNDWKMLAINHLLVSLAIGVAVTLSSLTGGFLIDVDHFTLKNIATAPQCALVTDKLNAPKECPGMADRGLFHTPWFGLMLLAFTFSWLAHMFMDYGVVQWKS